VRVPNRVLLAPLAGIGNWFVRLQAKRHGAGMAVSEMVSSHAIHYGNVRTCTEMLRIDPRERAGGPVSIQLFGESPAMMRSAARRVAEAGADAIDINMGCPVPKVQKTGAGAALLANPDLAVALARAAVEGAAEGRAAMEADGLVPGGLSAGGLSADGLAPGGLGAGGLGAGGLGPGGLGAGGLPITVKLRSGLRPGDTSGFRLAHRLVEEAGVAAIAFHPRSAAVHHRGTPDYQLAASLAASLPAPVILTGGLHEAAHVREAFHSTGATAVMLARGALGNPWLFGELLGSRECPPSREEVLVELSWTIDRAVEHLGEPRAGRYLRKFYPWYLARLGLEPKALKRLQESLQRADTLEDARRLLDGENLPAAVAL